MDLIIDGETGRFFAIGVQHYCSPEDAKTADVECCPGRPKYTRKHRFRCYSFDGILYKRKQADILLVRQVAKKMT